MKDKLYNFTQRISESFQCKGKWIKEPKNNIVTNTEKDFFSSRKVNKNIILRSGIYWETFFRIYREEANQLIKLLLFSSSNLFMIILNVALIFISSWSTIQEYIPRDYSISISRSAPTPHGFYLENLVKYIEKAQYLSKVGYKSYFCLIY